MSALVAVLPMTFVMIAGPQIISAVFLATSSGWARNSLAYITGAAISITAFVTISFLVVNGAKDGSPGEASTGGEGETLDAILLALLLLLAFRVYRGRKQAEPPKWMGKLQEAKPGFSFKLGLFLLGIFPTDILTSVAVGMKLAREGAPWWHALVFVALTLLLLAIPAILVVLLGDRAQTVLPKVRDWMNTNSWVVSELVIALFIGIELESLLSG
jgi:Sap, sulfolipid-1-addressing protein